MKLTRRAMFGILIALLIGGPTSAAEAQMEECQDRLEVYNLLGQRMATLVDELQQAGYATVRWDGKDQRGKPVASGIYIYQIRAGKNTATGEAILLR